jgi:hypothetical protein
MRLRVLLAAVSGLALMSTAAWAQVSVGAADQSKGEYEDAFRQFEGEDWPSPNVYRAATGEPGPQYWQQKVDYVVDVRLDEAGRSLTGSQRVTYQNNSPHELDYLWVLLDQNGFKRNSMERATSTTNDEGTYGLFDMAQVIIAEDWEGGFSNLTVADVRGRPIPFLVNDALMRIDLPTPLKPGERVTFDMGYVLAIGDGDLTGGRSGYECFRASDGEQDCIFQLAQWFPRLAAFSDYEGWHQLPYLGSEFPLEFGDYQVSITVPADHVVAASGVLANDGQVLTAEQRRRYAAARTATDPVYIVNPAEAAAAELGAVDGTRTWTFRAENVRDFAWASSRKFVWDAMGVPNADPEMPVVMAMSFYPGEARPLWDQISTRAVAHALDVYGEATFPYPYPTAQSVNGPVGGMEYPMITFNGARPVRAPDGTPQRVEDVKYALAGVIIHEIGHIWFPMVVNSDERQWVWMDEGINTFVEFQASKLWDADFDASGEPRGGIIRHMLSENQQPLMTNAQSLTNYGYEGYVKPGVALTVLRETVMGRELFDRAFAEYGRRWKFKRATPYDFFRTMEEVSGMDLDWFWRGWFYSTDHVDIALDSVVVATMAQPGAGGQRPQGPATPPAPEPSSVTVLADRAEGRVPLVERMPALDNPSDDGSAEFPITDEQRRVWAASKDGQFDDIVARARSFEGKLYHLTFSNVGGVVMPIIVQFTFDDGTVETVKIPAEVWRQNNRTVTWQYVTNKTVTAVMVDPMQQTADADLANNGWPREAAAPAAAPAAE